MNSKIISCLGAIGVYSALVEKGFTFSAIVLAVVIGALIGKVVSELGEGKKIPPEQATPSGDTEN